MWDTCRSCLVCAGYFTVKLTSKFLREFSATCDIVAGVYFQRFFFTRIYYVDIKEVYRALYKKRQVSKICQLYNNEAQHLDIVPLFLWCPGIFTSQSGSAGKFRREILIVRMNLATTVQL